MKGKAASCRDGNRKEFNSSGSVQVQCHFCATSDSEDEAFHKRKEKASK